MAYTPKVPIRHVTVLMPTKLHKLVHITAYEMGMSISKFMIQAAEEKLKRKP